MEQGIFLTAHQAIKEVFGSIKTIAMIGASANPDRLSYEVMEFLLKHDYDVIPVNPGLSGQKLLGKDVYSRLIDIPVPIDMVDIFRNSAAVGAILDEMLHMPIRPKILWTQIGVYDEDSAQKAISEGLVVIMDRCPKIELS